MEKVEEEGMEKAEEVAAGWAAVSLHTLQQIQLVNRSELTRDDYA